MYSILADFANMPDSDSSHSSHVEKQRVGILWKFQVHTIAVSVRRLGATKPRFKSHLHIASDLGIGL